MVRRQICCLVSKTFSRIHTSPSGKCIQKDTRPITTLALSGELSIPLHQSMACAHPLFRFSVTAELLERMENCPAIESGPTAVQPTARRPASFSAVQPPTACQSAGLSVCHSPPARRPASLSLRLQEPPAAVMLPPQPPKRDLPAVGGTAPQQQSMVADYSEGSPPPRPPTPVSVIDGPAVSPSTTPDLLRFPRCDEVRLS
jgi:hypothetical protein